MSNDKILIVNDQLLLATTAIHPYKLRTIQLQSLGKINLNLLVLLKSVVKKLYIQVPITSKILRVPNPNFKCTFLDMLKMFSQCLVMF